MSKHSKPVRRGNPAASSSPQRRKSGPMFVMLALVVVAAVGFWWWRPQRAGAPPTVAHTADTPATNAAPAVTGAGAQPAFPKLKGKWLRPDGGYVLEIKSVDDRGQLDAAYANPKPIHVAKAEASAAGTAIKVFIELRDVNYPGSTYTLAYDPENDQLKGIYYQALQQQSFEVNFIRLQ